MTATAITHVACLTPTGTGAIAVLAIHGDDGWRVVRELFRAASGQSLPESPREAGTVWFGRIADSGIADEVVLTIKQHTPVLWLELHTHGGRQVVDWMIEVLVGKGLTACSWEQFLRLGNDAAGDAAAWELLARAPTARTAMILLDQAQGAWRAELAGIAALCRAHQTTAAINRVDELLRQARLGMHLLAPWVVVVAGPPNVGKSSLVNALAGFQRSIVAAIAGTTRDVVSTVVAIDGWPVDLRDTAGLREDASGLEAAGIERARAAIKTADLILWLIDAVEPDLSTSLGTNSNNDPDQLTILNKCDLVEKLPAIIVDVRVSARTGAGLPELCAAISGKLAPNPPAGRAGIPYQASHIAALDQIRLALTAGDMQTAGELLCPLQS